MSLYVFSGGLFSGTKPSRAQILFMCVSTGNRSALQANERTTLIVLTPIPLTCVKVSSTHAGSLSQIQSRSNLPQLSAIKSSVSLMYPDFAGARPAIRIAFSIFFLGVFLTIPQVGYCFLSSAYPLSLFMSLVLCDSSVNISSSRTFTFLPG